MSLQFARNYRIIILLIAILSLLAVAMGDQAIVAYSIEWKSPQPTQEETVRSDDPRSVPQLVGLIAACGADSGLQNGDGDEVLSPIRAVAGPGYLAGRNGHTTDVTAKTGVGLLVNYGCGLFYDECAHIAAAPI